MADDKIAPDAVIRSDNFIDWADRDATPANDEGRGMKLEDDGELHPGFTKRIVEFTLGEDLTLMDPVFRAEDLLYDSEEISVADNDTNIFSMNSGNNNHYAFVMEPMPFTMKVKRVTFYVRHNGSATAIFNAKLYAVDGSNEPTGSALGSVQITVGGTNQLQAASDEYGSEVELTKGTKYALVVDVSPTTDSDTTEMRGDNATSIFTHTWTSSDGGSTWASASLKDIYFVMHGYCYEEDEIHKAKAKYATCLHNFLGFAAETETDGNDGEVILATPGTRVTGFTGLTAGSRYYLQDDGTLGTTPGTYEFEIGRADSATSIVIRKNMRVVSAVGANAVDGPTPFDSFDLTNDFVEKGTFDTSIDVSFIPTP